MDTENSNTVEHDPSLHLVCPHCSTTNRVRHSQLGSDPSCGQCKRALFTAKPISVAQAQFEKHLGRDGIPLLVDFWAPWCRSCQMQTPILEKLVTSGELNVKILKINTDANTEVAQKYNVVSMPTLILFENGNEIERYIGVQPESILKKKFS